MKKRKSLLLCPLALIIFLWAAVSLAGCGSKSANAVAENAAAGDYYAAQDRMMPQEGGAAYAATEAAAAETAAGTYEMDDAGITDTSGLNQAVAGNRKLIRNVNMDVESTDFTSLISQITAKINELGGYVELSNVSGTSVNAYSSSARYADITARIPADKLDSFIQTVQTAGNVTNKSEQVTDVTLQYSDMESRQKSLKIEQDRLWALLEKADTLEAVIALESRLSEIRYQLESYESQLKLYDNQVAYSTVSLYVSEVKTFTPAAPDSVGTRMQKGFQRSVNELKDSGINFCVWIVSNSPILLLWIIVIVIVLLIIRKFRKRLFRSIGTRNRPFYEHSDYEKEPAEKEQTEDSQEDKS